MLIWQLNNLLVLLGLAATALLGHAPPLEKVPGPNLSTWGTAEDKSSSRSLVTQGQLLKQTKKKSRELPLSIFLVSMSRYCTAVYNLTCRDLKLQFAPLQDSARCWSCPSVMLTYSR